MNDATARLLEASIDDASQEADPAHSSEVVTDDDHYYYCDPIKCAECAMAILEKEVNSAE